MWAKLHEVKPLLAKRRRESLLLGIGPYDRLIRVQPKPRKPKIGNVLDIGPSQCGKSTREIGQILEWEGSVVTNDIKRQLRSETAGYRRLLGPIYTVDITGRRNKYDPLEGRHTQRQLYASAYHLLYNPNDKETYFTERATRMLTQLFLAAREETRQARRSNPEAKEIRPLPYVSQLILLGLNRVAARINAVSPLLAERFLESAYTPAKDYEESKARADSWSTLCNRLYPILTDDIVPTFDGCDFTAKDLLFAKDPVTVYFCWPEAELHALKPLVRLVWESLLNDFLHTYDHYAERYTAKYVDAVAHNVLWAMDEAGVTDLTNLPEKAATVNGRGGSFSLSAQDIEQFVSLYGFARAHSLLSNIESKVVHRLASLDSAKYFRDWLDYASGFAASTSVRNASESEGKMEREVPLLTVRQIAELDDEEIIVLHRNFKPIQAKRMSIEKYPVLVERQQLAAPPVSLLPPPELPPFLPNWRRRYLHHGALRLDAGAYPLFAPEAVAQWPIMYRNDDAQ
jgi:type IV secretory pathway TraG/TraD family ATPase VirD4